MRNTVFYGVLGLSLIGWSCVQRSGGKQSSDVSQLTENNFKCRVDPGRSATIKSRIGTMPNFLRNWDDAKKQQIYNALAEIPDPYLEYLYDLNKTKGFYIAPMGAGSGGVTQLSGNGTTEWPDHIFLSSTIDIEYGLPHEVGHAVEPYVIQMAAQKAGMSWTDYKTKQYLKDVGAAQKEAMSNSKVRDYAHNPDEFFPEIFANWYCSPEAKEFVAKLGPNSIGYNFMGKYVLPPLYESGGSTPPTQQPLAIYLTRGSSSATGDDHMAILAASNDTDYVVLCNADKATCTQNPVSVVNFNKAASGPNRSFFAASQVFYLNNQTLKNPWTLLAFKADKTLLSSHSVSFSK